MSAFRNYAKVVLIRDLLTRETELFRKTALAIRELLDEAAGVLRQIIFWNEIKIRTISNTVQRKSRKNLLR